MYSTELSFEYMLIRINLYITTFQSLLAGGKLSIGQNTGLGGVFTRDKEIRNSIFGSLKPLRCALNRRQIYLFIFFLDRAIRSNCLNRTASINHL